jgi:hypothetical protein
LKASGQNDVQQEVTEVLLIGTFHYNNPGTDVAKTKSFDILKYCCPINLKIRQKGFVNAVKLV